MKKATIFTMMLVLLAVFALAVDSDHTYTATVGAVSNIVVTELDVSFSNCQVAGNCDDITDSLTIENQGNTNPSSNMTAEFTTTNTTMYGLNASATDWIPGDNFGLNGVALTNDGTTVVVATNTTLTAGYDQNWNATLSIPAGQAAGSYSGEVRLSWTA